MVKKETKKEAKKVSETIDTSSCSTNEGCTNVFSIITLILLAVLIVLSVMILNNVSSNSNTDRISSIEDKVGKIDSFFTTNVPGYGGADTENNQVAAADTNNNNNNNNNNNKVDYKIDLNSLDDPMEGSRDAKVTIVEFSDYECPFCERFYSNTYSQLKADYIDTGKVNLVFKDFPLDFHQDARPAAIAANCVKSQLGDETYFKMHNKIFENQNSMTTANLELWATSLGVNVDEYKACIVSDEVNAEIDADIAEGRKVGVSGTPSFIINGELIVGAQPLSEFKRIIDAKLNE